MKILVCLFLICYSFTVSAQSHIHEKHLRSSGTPVVSAAQQTLEESYDVKFHHLDLHVSNTSKYISGSVRTVAQVVGGTLDSFGFELHTAMIIDSVIQGGHSLAVSRDSNAAAAVLYAPAASGSLIDLTIYYHGTTPTGNSSIIGADGFNLDTYDSVSWSLSESYHAYEWWPCKQALQDKIDSSWVSVTTEADNKVGSNGILTNTIVLPNNEVRYEWKSHHPIDYYLISIAIGHYLEYDNYAHPQGYADSILVQNYINRDPVNVSSVEPQLDTIPSIIELFSRLYGLYPFADEKYGQSQVSYGSSMENQTMSSMGWFDFEVNAHELSHQWFGDNVTCASWNNIHMNEGFASYSEYIAMQYLKDTATAQAHMRNFHTDILQPTVGSMYFDGADTLDENRIFDEVLVYEKGAAFNHMIRFMMNNDSLFFRSLQVYQQQFRGSTASVLDLKSVIESVSGIDFTQFYAQWYYGTGYPTFNLTYNYLNDTLSLRSDETVSSVANTPLFVTPVEYLIQRATAPDTIIRVPQNQLSMSYGIPMTGTDVIGIITDPNNWILNTNGTLTRDSTFIVHDTTTTPVTTGMRENLIDRNLYLYPNPAKSQTQIYGYRSGMNAVVYDYMGKLTSVNISDKGVIDMSGIASGVYQMKVSDGIATKTLKLVKLD